MSTGVTAEAERDDIVAFPVVVLHIGRRSGPLIPDLYGADAPPAPDLSVKRPADRRGLLEDPERAQDRRASLARMAVEGARATLRQAVKVLHSQTTLNAQHASLVLP